MIRHALQRALAVGILMMLGPAGAAPTGGVVRVEHRDPATAPTRGPANALVTIEYFYIPQANASSRLPAYRALERLAARHPARIRIIYRIVKRTAQIQLPIAALEAHAQGKFAELMEALHTPRMNNLLTKEQVLELARGVGMDVPRLAAAISEGRYDDVFAANDRRLERLHGSPSGVLFNSRVVRASSDAEYEREYLAAYERSLELLDQGYDPGDLSATFDAQVRRADQPFVMSSDGDEDLEEDPSEHVLASPPLELAGLPSFGRPEANAPLPVVVLCRPNDASCLGLLRIIRRQVQDIYSDELRAVWAPWFDVTDDRATELTLLGDAALCAEQVGSSPDELSASPGWLWITKQLDHAGRAHGRRIAPDKLIDGVSRELDIDTQRLSACRARMANTTLDWIARARRSGVTRSPAVVIGGRIYEGLTDEAMIHRLIEAELAPGLLGETVESQFDRLLFFLSGPRRSP